jgi:hypothetical protein
MKKTIGLFAVAALFAVGSAFVSKYANPTGWALVSGSDVSGLTNESDCSIQTGTDCFIVVSGQEITPVYDSKADIGNAAKVLKTKL